MGIKRCHCPPARGIIGPRVTCLSKLLRKAFNEAVAEEGLFSGQQDIVFTLLKTEGMTLSDLAETLGISVATASVSIKRMEKAGFIVKKADDKDARITRVYPTEKAKRTPKHINEKMEVIENILKKDMTEEQALVFSDLLDTAIKNMSER